MAQFEDLFDYQLDFLQDEIETIQKNIMSYDNLSFLIKGWSITLWSLIIVYGARERIVEISLIAIPVIIALWLLDTYFKTYQRHFTFRMMVIERFLNNECEYEKRGIYNAFIDHSFLDFPVHDIRGRFSKDQSPELRKRFLDMTCFRNCFFSKNICFFYITLLLLTLIIASHYYLIVMN